MEKQGNQEGTIHIETYYGSLPGMLKKYERTARSGRFTGNTAEEFEFWRKKMRERLKELIGLSGMEYCDLSPRTLECVEIGEGIRREKILLQVEPDTWMPVYLLVPKGKPRGVFLALPGHLGGGKYSVAGCREIPAVRECIEKFHYDYGLRLVQKGYVTLCPDNRGFGERRDEALRGDTREHFLNSTCFHLAHMAEPLGQTVIGMCTWDSMRLLDYVSLRGEWDVKDLGCVGFSGGGMQTLWLAALDDRVKRAVISGYMYGYRDSLLVLNGNCSCNYVPGLWQLADMGDIGSLIAPRRLIVQSCRDDRLNGVRGLENVYEQTAVIKKAYSLYGQEALFLHDIREGEHCFHPEVLDLPAWV